MRHQSDKFFNLHYKLLLVCFLLVIIALWKDQYPVIYLIAFYTFVGSQIAFALGYFYRNDKQVFLVEILKAVLIFILATFSYF
jgi:hypothetical protein